MADYIEFTVNVNENTGSDSQSSIDGKVKNSSNRPSENDKLINQARDNMKENKSEEEKKDINGKAIKSYIMNNVVKQSANTAIRLAEEYTTQQYKYSGNTALMNRFNNTVSSVKDVYSFGSSVVGYTTAGATVGGGWGAAIGAILGLVMESINLNTEYNSKRASLDWELNNEKFSGIMTANRLGLVTASRGRIAFNEFLM